MQRPFRSHLSVYFLNRTSSHRATFYMENQLVRWTIEINDLATQLRVGILDSERDFQPIRVRVSIRALTPAFPQSIDDCLDYQPICRWIVDEWPKQPHTPLLETKVLELVRFVLACDARVEWVDVTLSKAGAVAGAGSVEITMARSRQEHEADAMHRPRSTPDRKSVV